jgi:hypothetical protein
MNSRYSKDGRNQGYVYNLKVYEDMSPHLDSLGIHKDDRVVVLTDPTINTSLYFLDRKGWTAYSDYTDSIRISKTIGMGADFLMANDSVRQLPGVEPFTRDFYAEFKGIEIYDLRGYRKE